MQNIFTFSVPGSKPKDLKFMKAVKEYCEKEDKNFSATVIKALKERFPELTPEKSNDRRSN